MFAVIFLQICVLGAPSCGVISDNWGPYRSLEICEGRLDYLLDISTKGIETYGYRAFCAEIDEDGEPVGEWKQYVREGDSYEMPKLGIGI